MARYSRRTFPTVDFTLPATFADVPQSTVTRFWDDGELLILIELRVSNGAAAVRTPLYQITRDGAPQGAVNRQDSIPSANARTLTLHYLMPITEGQHTIILQAQRDTDATQTIAGLSGTLTIIQLPLWDSDADIL